MQSAVLVLKRCLPFFSTILVVILVCTCPGYVSACFHPVCSSDLSSDYRLVLKFTSPQLCTTRQTKYKVVSADDQQKHNVIHALIVVYK